MTIHGWHCLQADVEACRQHIMTSRDINTPSGMNFLQSDTMREASQPEVCCMPTGVSANVFGELQCTAELLPNCCKDCCAGVSNVAAMRAGPNSDFEAISTPVSWLHATC